MTHDAGGNALVLYRLESAREKLTAAKDLLENKHYKDSVSRSYYVIFTAARALLATRQTESPRIPKGHASSTGQAQSRALLARNA